ncbi:MAG: hypothetical protein ACOH2D_11715 [Gelidibacter sp.]
MSQPKFKIKVNKDGTIDATLLGSLPDLICALVDVMDQNDAVRVLVQAANDFYKDNA